LDECKNCSKRCLYSGVGGAAREKGLAKSLFAGGTAAKKTKVDESNTGRNFVKAVQSERDLVGFGVALDTSSSNDQKLMR